MKLDHLNKAQKEAVVHTDGPVMILAGAGSGKTRTLVSRIQYLIEEKSVSPFRILALTFSNKAAREMRERIARDNNIDFGSIQVTTFHSFCARLLRNEAQYIGLSRNFTIYDTSESKSIVKTLLGQKGINQKEVHPNEILGYIDALKNLGFYLGCNDSETLDDIDEDDAFYSFFREFEGELHKSNAVDFGGLITGVLNLLDNFPEVLERYQKRFHYVLVDEYQDTNRAQFRLVKLLSEKRKNICVVGDEDQSIYSWRGADIRNILDFERVFPEAKIIKLEQNYRSSKNIIEAASCVISRNVNRKGKELWTDNDRGESIQVVECPDDKTEADFVAKEVQSIIAKGVDPRDIAVFYRANAQSRMIEDAFRKLNIPYKVVAGMKFYERKEIKDMLSYLRCVVNEKDSLALSRVINTPVRGIGARTLRKIEDEAIKFNVSLWEMLNLLTDNYEEYKHLKLNTKVKRGISLFVGLIHEAILLEKDNAPPTVIYEKILHESGYLESLEVEKTYEAQGRIENLEELLSAIKQFQEDDEKPSIVGFLETITLDESNIGNGEEIQPEVSMMTIHGSKGLEYLYVFTVGLEENVFPSYQCMDGGEEAMEEERRLFYVAMTRAMKKLYLTFAQSRMLWGSLKFNPPSRFLDEVPEDYYQWKSLKSSRGKSFSQSSSGRHGQNDFDEFSQVNSYEESGEVTYVRSAAEIEYKFPVGSRVQHKLYGSGKVSDAEGLGQEEKVVIKFNDGTRKKFLVKFAPLEKI